MSSASYFVSPQQLWSSIGTADAPMILDVCRRAIYDAGAGVIPTSHWQQPETYADWVPGLPAGRPIVLACRYGHNLSQMVAAELRSSAAFDTIGRPASAQASRPPSSTWAGTPRPRSSAATIWLRLCP